MKILLLGTAQSGKDTMAEILHEEFGLSYKSSSMAAVEIFIFNVLKYKYQYKTMVECFEDRVNHRSEWFDLITNYNKEDRTRLTKEILKISDCYVGLRMLVIGFHLKIVVHVLLTKVVRISSLRMIRIMIPSNKK